MSKDYILKNTQNELHDDSPMPFGKHKGELMQEVPAYYLHWCRHNIDRESPVGRYIQKNLHALSREFPDAIWT